MNIVTFAQVSTARLALCCRSWCCKSSPKLSSWEWVSIPLLSIAGVVGMDLQCEYQYGDFFTLCIFVCVHRALRRCAPVMWSIVGTLLRYAGPTGGYKWTKFQMVSCKHIPTYHCHERHVQGHWFRNSVSWFMYGLLASLFFKFVRKWLQLCSNALRASICISRPNTVAYVIVGCFHVCSLMIHLVFCPHPVSPQQICKM